MEVINNTSKTLRDDLSVEIKEGSKLSIAAACFSIYAFQALKDELQGIDELRFIFTSPTFVTEKAKKEKREFYIPRLNRERSLYGTEFEVKLRNELTQKAIAKECAEWIKDKVKFKSNISDKSIQGMLVVDDTGYTPINNFTTVELGCEKGNIITTTIFVVLLIKSSTCCIFPFSLCRQTERESCQFIQFWQELINYLVPTHSLNRVIVSNKSRRITSHYRLPLFLSKFVLI